MATKLSAAINQGQWDLCINLARNDTSSATLFAHKPGSLKSGPFVFGKDLQGLPIHEAVAVGAPLEVIDAIARAFPEGLTKRDLVMKRLPIHLACNRERVTDGRVITLLGKYYTKGLMEADRLGRVALHYALKNGASDATIRDMLKLCPNAAKAQDKKGVVPLHIACVAHASTAVIQALLQLNPDASVMVTSVGKNALSFCNDSGAPNKLEVANLLYTYKQQVDGQFRLAAQPSSRRLLV